MLTDILILSPISFLTSISADIKLSFPKKFKGRGVISSVLNLIHASLGPINDRQICYDDTMLFQKTPLASCSSIPNAQIKFRLPNSRKVFGMEPLQRYK